MIRRYVPSILIIVTVIVMLVLSWRRWCDPLVDFGRELYVPWQLAEGATLYKDIAYFNGPLSPHFNAMLFKIFGTSLLTLILFNTLILCVLLMILHRICLKLSNPILATSVCVLIVPILCIAQPGPMANYNFINPYSHEMTHGLILGLGAIACLILLPRGVKSDLLCGLLAGLTILTKPEIALASVGAIAMALILLHDWKTAGRIMGMMALPPLLCVMIFGSAGFEAWRAVFNRQLTSLLFYRKTMGTDDVGGSLMRLAVAGGMWLAVPILARMVPRRMRFFDWLAGALVLGWGGLLWFNMQVDWRYAGAPLILTTFLLLIRSLYVSRKHSGDVRRMELNIAFAIFGFFALLLLGKIALNVTLSNYGFALALPALVVTALAGARWLGNGAIIGALAAIAFVHLHYSIPRWNAKTIPMGAGPDLFYVLQEHLQASQFHILLDRLPGGATVSVLPQGVMLNYLAQRPSGFKYIVQMPPEMLMFGDETIAGELKRSGPSYIIYLPQNMYEYGFDGFRRYAPQTAAVMDYHYSLVDGNAGWRVLKRKDLP